MTMTSTMPRTDWNPADHYSYYSPEILHTGPQDDQAFADSISKGRNEIATATYHGDEKLTKKELSTFAKRLRDLAKDIPDDDTFTHKHMLTVADMLESGEPNSDGYHMLAEIRWKTSGLLNSYIADLHNAMRSYYP